MKHANAFTLPAGWRILLKVLGIRPGAEISFLLGFEDPNSFFRAFHSWTGQTPRQVRAVTAAGWS